MAQELDPPAATLMDPKAIELLRVWAASQKQHVSIRADIWEDPGNWGIFLVDLAHHIADAYAHRGKDPDEVLSRIRTTFDAEWDSPTDTPKGSFKS